MKNAGMIELLEGYTFLWMRGGDEISGLIEGPDHQIIERHTGWYRTNDPDVAAQRAKTNLEYELNEGL